MRKGLTPEEFAAEEAREFELPAPALLRERIVKQARQTRAAGQGKLPFGNLVRE